MQREHAAAQALVLERLAQLRGAVDGPAVIGQQVAAGVVVRMAVLYELLAGRTAPDRGGITVGAGA